MATITNSNSPNPIDKVIAVLLSLLVISFAIQLINYLSSF